MIDKVKLRKRVKKIPKRVLEKNFKQEEKREENFYYSREIGSGRSKVKITYSTKTDNLEIEGRLVNLHKIHNRVYNFDDYIIPRLEEQSGEIYEIKGIEDILKETNKALNELLEVDYIDIRQFEVLNIEICFNLFLNDCNKVEAYLDIFNRIVEAKKDKRYQAYSNHRNESLWIKTKADYNNNTKTNRIINFYNKEKQLERREKKGLLKRTPEERSLSKGLLRLEVQLYYQALLNLFGVTSFKGANKEKRFFKNFLDINRCYYVIERAYKDFISENIEAGFYSYELVKRSIPKDTIQNKNLLKYILNKTRNKLPSRQTQKKYNSLLLDKEINNEFIPRKYNLDYLESPIILLQKKIAYILMEQKSTR